MIDFQLKIYLGLYDKAVEKAVREMTMPEDVKTEIFSFSDHKNEIPENVTAVFITDKTSLLRSAFALRKKNLRVVYCGHAEDARKVANKLEALWPAGESIEIIKKRFMILIKNLRNEFYAWFYQNTLLATINNMPFPTVIFSADWKIIRTNPAFEEISGIKPETVQTFNYQHWKQEKLMPVNNSEISEYRMEKNGEIKYFIIREQEIRDIFDNISGYFLIMQDIT